MPATMDPEPYAPVGADLGGPRLQAVTWRTRGGLVKRCLPFATSALPECDTRHNRVRTKRG